MDYHFLLQGIFLQGSNPHLLCLLHWQAGSLPLAPPGKHKYKKDWLKDVLCSSVFFRKIFEIIKKSSYKCISSLSSIFQTSMYSCSSHCPESVLIYLTCCYQSENSKFHGGTGLRKQLYVSAITLDPLCSPRTLLWQHSLSDLCHNHGNKS